jgi:hypothetical protein
VAALGKAEPFRKSGGRAARRRHAYGKAAPPKRLSDKAETVPSTTLQYAAFQFKSLLLYTPRSLLSTGSWENF